MTSMPKPEPVPYRATARVDRALLADSSTCFRVDHPDAEPELWFPSEEVDISALDGIPSTAVRRGDGNLEGFISFNPAEVELTLLDPRAAAPGAPADPDDPAAPEDPAAGAAAERTRFPNWGDAADLVAILDVVGDGHGTYRGATRADWRRPVVEGSQILGQSIVAAARHAPDRHTVSASMVFPRAADSRLPYDVVLEELSGGRTFTTLGARAVQGNRLCATGTLLADVGADDVISHAAPMPDVAGPDEAEPYDMSVTGRYLRIVDGAYTGDPMAPVGPPVLDAWVRFADLPDDPALHAGLMAQFTGHMSIAAALRPHHGIGQDQAHRTLSTAINQISLSIHRRVHADEWMLYHHRSTVASRGMTHSECRVYSRDGALLASFSVDAMVRAFASPVTADSRTAM